MNAGKVILGALTIIGLLADIIDDDNRGAFRLLQYVKMCGDPIDINEFQRYFALILCRQSCKVVLPL